MLDSLYIGLIKATGVHELDFSSVISLILSNYILVIVLLAKPLGHSNSCPGHAVQSGSFMLFQVIHLIQNQNPFCMQTRCILKFTQNHSAIQFIPKTCPLFYQKSCTEATNFVRFGITSKYAHILSYTKIHPMALILRGFEL